MNPADVVTHAPGTAQHSVRVVRWRSGKLHISEDGLMTVCGSVIRPDRARILPAATNWAEHVNCYNCAYRHAPPPGYLSPRTGKDFPLKRECPNHPGSGLAADSCHTCDPSTLRPRNWPCPNGCTNPFDHNPVHRYTTCTVFPDRRERGSTGRCIEACESTERAMHRANPNLSFDLADSASFLCYRCGEPVCVGCQRTAVERYCDFCIPCSNELN
ncbi:hypothetical protein [Lentzea sp. HUAS12]|uniref:hypothetical protein n=1 Tax=Lentzea sp. HUAS12 TaxID=2951806 RepID=UPI0020A10AA0|nr:hypothetical protein [Lentzea sp. HUAS12]USX54105.1 hypothetical protein ND450_08395 [Lentzea sp. HUAS12]